MGLLGESYYFFRRAIKKLVRNPIVLMFSLIQPIIFLFIFTQLFDGFANLPNWEQVAGVTTYLAFAAPGIIMMNAFSSALQSGVTMVDDIQSGFMDKVLVTPARRSSILLGRMMADAVRIIVQSVILISLALPIGAVASNGIGGIAAVIGIIAFFGLAWAGISHSIGLRTKNQQAVFSAGFLLTFPLMFMSTMLVPNIIMKDWIRDVSQYNPISFAVNAIRSLMILPFSLWEAPNWAALEQSVLVIAGIAVLSLGSAILAFKKVVE